MRFEIDGGRVVVTARSSVHDTTTTWRRVTGQAELDPADPARGAALSVEVDMRELDAGDFLRNRKLRKDLDLERHPIARYRLTELAVRSNDVAFGADHAGTATGVLSWRGRDLPLEAAGHAWLDREALRATARFDLDVRRLGVTPPRFLMLKVEDVVAISVDLTGRAVP